ncbi:MAG: WXG100 family type VII secretion target [Haloechinothrix sp.]
MSINVNYGALQVASDDIKSTTTQVNGILDQLKSDIAPLVNTWEGEAQTAYREKQAQWDQAAEDINKVLASIGTAVNDALGRYQEGEGSATRMFQ